MFRIFAIICREMSHYFFSPIAYIVIVAFLLINGWFLFSNFFLAGQLTLSQFFNITPIVLIFFTPAITMRLVAEEKNTGSIEALLTLPVSELEVVIAKFISAFLFLFISLVFTLSYPLSISLLGNLDWGVIISGYLGLVLMGGAFLSMGLLMSTLSKNQIIAFILGLFLCLFFYLIDKVLIFLPGFSVNFFEYSGVDYHFRNLAKGVIDTRDLIYFVSIMFTGIFLSSYILKRRTG
ncbi:MAG: ABC transporter permease subunit [Thermodesulfobacteriota bacterium]|nr:ABC transporter permease subunit [Thermodesulfobacteriota bacterium]